jgi:hypothetical protein
METGGTLPAILILVGCLSGTNPTLPPVDKLLMPNSVRFSVEVA